MNFRARELRDLAIAWIALGVAFTFFFAGVRPTQLAAFVASRTFAIALAISLVTAGVGFLLHELAHKVVAVRYGQYAEFRADFGMLFLAVVGGLAGFLFAAPGAVHHEGRLTARQHGFIALAGPVTNLALAAVFLPVLFVPGFVGDVGARGLYINLLLAGFNMLPFGPLDGNTVMDWSKLGWALVGIPSILLAAAVLFV